MRYKSAPVAPEERQETTRERATRQRRERQEELRYTASDEKRWAENRELNRIQIHEKYSFWSFRDTSLNCTSK
jgi:hypothetical protein